MRLTIQAGTVTEYKDGSEITENFYYQNVDELMNEFEKQKSEFKNPNVTEDDIMKLAEKLQDTKRIQKLGKYEDIDESPEHLAKVKRAFDIIKEKQIDVLYIAMFPNSLDKYNKHVSFIGNDKWCLTQEEFDLLKEVLL